MDAAAALDDVERLDLQNVASRKTSGDDLARLLVVAIVETRHDDTAIGKIEVDVARLERPSAPVGALHQRLLHFDDLNLSAAGIARRAQDANRLHHRREIGMRARTRNADEHAAGCDKTSDVVDMPVSLVIGETLAQPDHAPGTGKERQTLFDLLSVEMRIAIGIEQALIGGQKRTLPVGVDGAAFGHQRRRIETDVGLTRNAAGQLGIVGPGMILVAPGVELPLYGTP